MRLDAPLSSARWLGGAQELCIQLLGRFSVQVEARLLPELARRRRPAVLLQLLALAPGRGLHREEVLDRLWPELEPEAAANNLHVALHVLRRLLEPDLARGALSTYVAHRGNLPKLHAPGVLRIDMDAFELACAVPVPLPAMPATPAPTWASSYAPATCRVVSALSGRPAGASSARSTRALRLELATLCEAWPEPWPVVCSLKCLVARAPAREEARGGRSAWLRSGRPAAMCALSPQAADSASWGPDWRAPRHPMLKVLGSNTAGCSTATVCRPLLRKHPLELRSHGAHTLGRPRWQWAALAGSSPPSRRKTACEQLGRTDDEIQGSSGAWQSVHRTALTLARPLGQEQ
jgi:hypothetical protein